MAFLAEFEYDGFVSYAHSQYDRWAREFVAELEQLVAGGLNAVASIDDTLAKDTLKFWMDPETEGNRPLSDNLKRKVERSACIIVLLTPRFLKSDWCNRELDWFQKTIRSKTQGQSLPFFMVQLARTERSEWPPFLRDIPGYNFVGDPELNAPIGYQGPGQRPQGQEYWNALRDLAREIVEHLKARRRAPIAANKPKGDSNLQIVQTPPESRPNRPAVGKPRVYLGEAATREPSRQVDEGEAFEGPRREAEKRFKADRPEDTEMVAAAGVPERNTADTFASASIFISYSHKDTRWVDRLQVHLRPMERDGLIRRWDDRLIMPGRNWRQEIASAIEVAKIAILMISADFLASEFISHNELPPLLQAARNRGTHILPMLVKPSQFLRTPILSTFQALNSPSRTLIAMRSAEREELFVDVSDRIAQILGRA